MVTAIGVVTIQRDPLDRPITTTAPGATRTAYDTAGPVATLDSAGNIIERLWQLPGGVTVTVTPTAQQWTYPDLHGDTAVTATTSGVLSARSYVDPYGTPLTSTPLRADRTTLAGFAQWARTTSTIANLAIIDLQARPYLPALGRFAALDPIPGGATPNNYAYPTDPHNTYDLNGQCAWGWKCLSGNAGRLARNVINTPASTLGGFFALANGMSCQRDRVRDIYVCSGGSRRMGMRHSGTTWGSVYLASDSEGALAPERVRHEAKHANQWAAFNGGAAFATAYLLVDVATRARGGPCNSFESQAGLNDGGKGRCG